MTAFIESIPGFVGFGFALCALCGLIGFGVNRVWSLVSHLVLHK